MAIDVRAFTRAIRQAAEDGGWVVVAMWLSRRGSQYLVCTHHVRATVKVRVSNHGGRARKGERLIRVESERGLRSAQSFLLSDPKPRPRRQRRSYERKRARDFDSV